MGATLHGPAVSTRSYSGVRVQPPPLLARAPSPCPQLQLLAARLRLCISKPRRRERQEVSPSQGTPLPGCAEVQQVCVHSTRAPRPALSPIPESGTACGKRRKKQKRSRDCRKEGDPPRRKTKRERESERQSVRVRRLHSASAEAWIKPGGKQRAPVPPRAYTTPICAAPGSPPSNLVTAALCGRLKISVSVPLSSHPLGFALVHSTPRLNRPPLPFSRC